MTTFRIILSMLVVLAMGWGLLLASPLAPHRLFTGGVILVIALAGALGGPLLGRRAISRRDGRR